MSAVLRGDRRRYLSPREFAEATGMKVVTVQKQCERGQLRTRPHEPNKSWRIIASEVERVKGVSK